MLKKIVLTQYYIFFFFVAIFAQNTEDESTQLVVKNADFKKDEKQRYIRMYKNDANPLIEIEGSAEVEITRSMSEQNAQDEVIKMARLNALEQKFGTAIISSTYLQISNKSDGKTAKSTTDMTTSSMSEIKGEWIADVSSEIKIVSQDGKRYCQCKVKCLARQLVSMPVQFVAKTRNCPQRNCTTTEFANDGSLYLYFNSPNAGYLSVFLVDGNESYRLLPYAKQEDGAFKVEANREYLLFSDKEPNNKNMPYTEEYQLFSENATDHNVVYVIFSEEPFNQPATRNASQEEKEDKISTLDLKKGYELPRITSTDDFNKWYNRLKVNYPNIQIEPISITISK